MTQSFISQFHGDSPILGASLNIAPTAEQAATPLTCLTGCISDHVDHAVRGWNAKQCEAHTTVRPFSPSYGAARWLIRGSAYTEGSVRTAEVGIMREGDHPDNVAFFDPEEARELASLLLAAAREAEDLARTAQAVTA